MGLLEQQAIQQVHAHTHAFAIFVNQVEPHQ